MPRLSPAALDHDAWQTFQVRLANDDVTVVSKPGFAHWDVVTPATMLLAECVDVGPSARVLLVGSGHGALGVALARRAASGHVSLIDQSVVAVAASQRTLAANEVGNAAVVAEPAEVLSWPARADLVVIETPRDRGLARRFLLEAHRVLDPGGDIYLAGANKLGIRSVVDDAAQLFGNVTTVDVRMKHRVAWCQRVPGDAPPLPWTAKPGVAPGTWTYFDAEAQGVSLAFASLPGVFSSDRIDAATQLLVDNLVVASGSRVLDVGCGCGVIGLFAARFGADQVDLVDADLLSVAATVENISRNGIGNASALPSDVLSAIRGRRYELVATNPPFHAGRIIDYHVARTFIEQAYDVIVPGGTLLLVANRFIPYDRLLNATYGNVRTVVETGQYRLFAATRTGDAC